MLAIEILQIGWRNYLIQDQICKANCSCGLLPQDKQVAKASREIAGKGNPGKLFLYQVFFCRALVGTVSGSPRMASPLPACRSPAWGQCCCTPTSPEPLTPSPAHPGQSRLVPTLCQELFGNWTGHKYRHRFWKERGNVYESPTLKMTSSCSWDAEVIPVFHPLQDNHKEERQNVGQRKSYDSKHYAHLSASLGTTTYQPLLQAPQFPEGCSGPAQRLSLPSLGIFLAQHIIHLSLSTLFFLNSVAIPFKT